MSSSWIGVVPLLRLCYQAATSLDNACHTTFNSNTYIFTYNNVDCIYKYIKLQVFKFCSLHLGRWAHMRQRLHRIRSISGVRMFMGLVTAPPTYNMAFQPKITSLIFISICKGFWALRRVNVFERGERVRTLRLRICSWIYGVIYRNPVCASVRLSICPSI